MNSNKFDGGGLENVRIKYNTIRDQFSPDTYDPRNVGLYETDFKALLWGTQIGLKITFPDVEKPPEPKGNVYTESGAYIANDMPSALFIRMEVRFHRTKYLYEWGVSEWETPDDVTGLKTIKQILPEAGVSREGPRIDYDDGMKEEVFEFLRDIAEVKDDLRGILLKYAKVLEFSVKSKKIKSWDFEKNDYSNSNTNSKKSK